MQERTARHRRRAGSEEDLAAVARRRVAHLARPEPGGWVPAPPLSPAAPQEAPSPRRSAAADLVPVGLRAAVFAPAGRAVGGLALLVLLAVAVALAMTWLSRPREQPVPPSARPVGAPLSMTPTAAVSPTADDAAAGGSTVVVHVAGAVRRPGVVELPAGSRVADAVGAAGGTTRAAAPASVNLARPLVDGEQVMVLRRGELPVAAGAAGPGALAGAGGGGTPSGATQPVDLNTASLEQLDSLPGIGPVLAQRILDWRTANGRFSAVDELGEVSGIGEATLADLRPLVTV